MHWLAVAGDAANGLPDDVEQPGAAHGARYWRSGFGHDSGGRGAHVRGAVPEAGNVNGVLGVLLKTDLELARGDPAEEAAIRERFASVKTVGDAQAYADEVRTKVTAAQANRAAKPPLPSRVG